MKWNEKWETMTTTAAVAVTADDDDDDLRKKKWNDDDDVAAADDDDDFRKKSRKWLNWWWWWRFKSFVESGLFLTFAFSLHFDSRVIFMYLYCSLFLRFKQDSFFF